MQTHRCLVKFVSEQEENIGEVMKQVDQSLTEKHGNNYIFEASVWWRQTCIDNDIYSHPEPIKAMTSISKEIGIAWDGYSYIQNFIDIFFKNEYWLNFEKELVTRGWVKQGPEVLDL
jgi:hypothetical protein